jgi:electron transport complex, rnfABCDGE type, G subunit
MKKLSFMKDAITLFIITMLSGFMLGAVYEITKEPIALAKENEKKSAYKEVFPDATDFQKQDDDLLSKVNDSLISQNFGKVNVSEVANALDSSGSSLGYVITSTSKDGFGGDVKISVGITKDKKLNGIAFLTLAETPGLGMKAKGEKFSSQFKEKDATFLNVVKTGATKPDEIDAISGATITSRAVTGAVNAAIYYVDEEVNHE